MTCSRESNWAAPLDWILITEGMPQGSWLGPLICIVYIDDLHPSCAIHKFMDNHHNLLSTAKITNNNKYSKWNAIGRQGQ